MSVQAGTAYVPFKGEYSGLISGLSATLTSAQMKAAGRKGGLAIGGALVAGVAAAGVGKAIGATVGKSIDFQSSFADVRKTVDASEKGYARLARGIRNMSKEIPTGANELAELAGIAGQLGIENRSILSFTRVVADLGETTNLHGEQAAATLARIANVMQTSPAHYDRLGASIVELGNNLATTEAEITEMALRIAGAGKQLGLTEAQVLGFAGALSSVGIEAQAGGSSISRALLRISSSVREGGKELDLFAKVAGLSAEQFQRQFERNAAGATVRFIEGLGKLREEGGDVAGTLEELGLNELRVRDALMRASNAGDLFRRSLQLGSTAWRENTALVEEASERYGTTEAQLQLLKNTWDEVLRSLGDRVRPTFDRMVRQVTRGVDRISRILNDPRLTGAEKFGEIAEFLTEAVVKGLGRAAEAALKLAPKVAEGFAKGFAAAPIWLQLASSALLLKMFGGVAGITAAGTRAGGAFTAAFASVTETYALARSFGRGKGASATAGFGSLALPMATSLFSSLKRVIPGVAAIFTIGDLITEVIGGDIKKALFKGGGTALGAALGAVLGPAGAAIGAAIGNKAFGALFETLFGGEAEKTLRERIQESTQRLAEGLKAEVASIANMRQAAQGQVRARARQKNAADAVTRAERALNRARREHGPASERARAAEARYRIALDNSRAAEDRLRRSQRLQGAERRATIRIMRDNVQEAKANIGRLRTERRELQAQREANLRNNGSLEELRDIQRKLRGNSKQLNEAQGRVNKTIQRAAQVIGPRFAQALERIDTKIATISRVMPQLSRTTETSMRKSRTATSRTSLKFEAFSDVVVGTREIYGQNVGRLLPQATGTGMGRINELLQKNLDAIQNMGIPQQRRRGGLVEWARQKFRGGGVPVALSPGELFKTPSGRAGIVPGKPTAADNVLTSMPVGTKIFTFDGQRRLAEGASESQALREQLPHFAGGGIVKPEITGGTKRGAEVANAAIGKVHAAAQRKLRRQRRAATSSNVPLGAGKGQIPQLIKLAESFGNSIGAYPLGRPGVHAENSYHYQYGRAFDASGGDMSGYFHAAAKRYGSRLAELFFNPPGWYIKNGSKVQGHIDDNHWDHVHTAMQRGGLIKAIQRLAGGGWVRVGYTTYSGSGGYKGDLGSKPAYAELGTASGVTGAATGSGYLAKQFGMSGELPHNFPIDIKVGSIGKVGRLYKQDRGWGQGDPFYSVDIHTSGFSEVGLTGHNKGVAFARPAHGRAGGGGNNEALQKRRQMAARRKRREKQIENLLKRAKKAKGSPLAQKGNLWQVLDLFAKYGDFQGKESQAFLRRAGSIASIANPSRGAGQLHKLVSWAQKHVRMTGADKENSPLSKRFELLRKRGGKRAERKRQRLFKTIERRGVDFPQKRFLGENEHVIKSLDEWIQIAERRHTAEWSDGGSEYTDAEVDYERRLNESLRDSLLSRLGLSSQAIKVLRQRRGTFQELVREASKPGSPNRWRLGAYRKGLQGTRQTLQNLLGIREEIVGVTGRGGRLGDVRAHLADLGVRGTLESRREDLKADLMRGQLTDSQRNLALLAAQLPVFSRFMSDIPKFHGGGVYRAPAGMSEGPALLRNNEVVFTPEQVRAMGSGDVVVNLYVDPDAGVNPEKIRVEVESALSGRASRVRRRVRSLA